MKLSVIFTFLISSVSLFSQSPNAITVAGGNGRGVDANQFVKPTGVFVDINGNIYVADSYAQRIQKWTPGATNGITVGGRGGINQNLALVSFPNSVFVNASGYIFITDTENHRILKWIEGDITGITVAGNPGYVFGGSGPNQLTFPSNVFIDAAGNMYISDSNNHRIQKWNNGASQGVTVAGGNGSGNAPRQLYYPSFVFVDAVGNIYICDSSNDRIQKWASGSSQGITVAGGNGHGNAANQLSYPNSIAVDALGFIYISDTGNNRIQKWAPGASEGITVAGGNGSGSGANQLSSPRGIFVDLSGSIYIADAENDRIQKIPNVSSNIKIVNLVENINQNTYSIPREATIHHYFLIKDNVTNAPLKDVVLNYTLGTVQRQSLPSDSTGLVDLNITTGGNDPNTSNDDWVGLGNSTVTFHSVQNGNVTGINPFTPFTITIVDKAQTIDKEMGIGVGLQIGNDAFSDNYKNKVDVGGGYKLKIGMSTGIKLGITASTYVKIKPVSNSIWNVYFNSGLKPFVGLDLGGGLSFGNKAVGLDANLSLSAQLDDAVRSEKGYIFDLTKKNDAFKLASLLFSMNKTSPSSLELSVIFDRLASLYNTAISNLSVKTELSYGLGTSISGNLKGRGKIYKLNLPGYGNIPEVSFDNSFSAGVRLNDNVIFESVKGIGNSFSNSISMSVDANNAIQGMVALTKGNKKNIPTIKSHPFSIFSGSLENGYTVKREEDFSGNPISASITLSSKSNELNIDSNSPKLYNVEYKNNYKYGSNALKNLYLTTYSVGDNSLLQNNSIALFLTKKSNSLVGSMIANQGIAGNFLKQSYDLNSFMTKTSKQYNFPINEIELNTTQEVTLIERNERNFNFIGFKTLDFKISLNSWKTYTHNKTNGKYIRSLDRTLITTDYSDIFSNLELPNTSPIEDIKTYLENALLSAGQTAIDYANQIITKVRNFVNQSVTLILTNLNQPRFNSFGEKIYDPKNQNLYILNTPSVFTFTIPGTTFAQNTAIDFKYYYPSNELKAITTTDTFRVISDVFTLTASLNSLDINQAPNGNFTIQTNFSTIDLTLASLPSNLVPVVLFLPKGATSWQQIGAINSTINFSQLGDYGIGVRISSDFAPPIIQVTNPIYYVAPNYFEVTLTDLKSGIDWKSTLFVANGKIIPVNRINNSNKFRINISDIPSKPSGIFIVEISTSDLADNTKLYTSIYPCDEYKIIKGLELEPDNPILKKAINFINSDTKTPPNKKVIFRAGQKIELKPGFETTGTLFKAEIGGCNN